MVEQLVMQELAGVTCERTDVLKPNGKRLVGYVVKDGGVAAPTIYPKDDLETDEDIARYIVQVYQNAPKMNIDPKEIFTQDFVLANVRPQVLNFAENDELLQKMAYKGILDLAIVFRVFISEDASFLVSKENANALNITVDQLYDAAVKNVHGKYECVSMCDMLRSMMAEKMGVDTDMIPMEQFDNPMHILSSKNRLYGAAALIDKDFLQEVSKTIGGNFIIIPSSIHELICLREDYNENDLNLMINDVNSTVVSQEEKLSDHVYFYNAETNELTM